MLPLLPIVLPLDSVATEEYEVEDILDSVLSLSCTEYVGKWVSIPVFESMWKHAAYLANISDITIMYFVSSRMTIIA